MRIKYENIILRDMIESDIEDYVRWFTVEREWENWDAPWEKEDTDEETERKSWTEYYESVKDRPDDARRCKFEIEWNGRHIGWVSSYCIDENYEWVGKIKDGQTVYRAIGIDICKQTFGARVLVPMFSVPLLTTILRPVQPNCTHRHGLATPG